MKTILSGFWLFRGALAHTLKVICAFLLPSVSLLPFFSLSITENIFWAVLIVRALLFAVDMQSKLPFAAGSNYFLNVWRHYICQKICLKLTVSLQESRCFVTICKITQKTGLKNKQIGGNFPTFQHRFTIWQSFVWCFWKAQFPPSTLSVFFRITNMYFQKAYLGAKHGL